MLLYNGYINHIHRACLILYTIADINIRYPMDDKYFSITKKKKSPRFLNQITIFVNVVRSPFVQIQTKVRLNILLE